MNVLISLVMVPLMLLNAFGGIVSGIWLAILGEWWALGYGFIALLSPFLLSIILAPSLIFLAPAGVLLGKQRPFFAFPLLLLGYTYTCLIITFWCMFVFNVFMTRANGDTFWPLLIWSYGVALGPWQYMTQKEERGGAGDASAITTLFAQIAYIVIALALVFGLPTPAGLTMVFGAIMFVGMLFQAGIGFALLRAESRRGPPLTTEQLVKLRRERPGYMDDAGRIG